MNLLNEIAGNDEYLEMCRVLYPPDPYEIYQRAVLAIAEANPNPTNLKSYFFIVCRNEHLKLLKEKSRYCELTDTIPDTYTPTDTTYDTLIRVLSEPAKTKRELFPRIVVDIVMELGSVAEASTKLDIPPSTIYYCISKIKHRINELNRT